MPRSRTIASYMSLLGVLALAGVGLTLAGCSGNGGHGSYTAERAAIAKERLQEIKSGTEWQMAQQQYDGGELDKALKSIDRSIKLNPEVAKSHVLRGRILVEKGRLEEARQEFLNAEKLDVKSVDAQYYLGIVHERFRQYDEALARYKHAMDLDINNPQYVVAAAEMLMETGKLDEADSLIADRRKYFEYNAALRQTLGHIAMLRGDAKLASQHFSEASLLAPSDTRVLEDLVQAEMACGEFADAEVNIGRLLEKDENKDRRDLKQLRARCLVSMDRPVDARSILIELTNDKEAGRDLRSWFELGNVSAILKDKGHLRLAASRAVAIAPEQPEGYTLRGMFARLDGRPEDAIAAFDQAALRSKDDASPLVFKAIVLDDLGRVEEAKTTLRTALQIEPHSTKAQTLLSVLEKGGNAKAGTAVVGHPDAAQ